MTSLTLSYLRSLVDDVTSILSREPSLIEDRFDRIAFVGDIHGDYETAARVLDRWDGATCWLGDYVDRGPMQIESIVAIMEAKRSEPRRIIALRGNHECRTQNYYYGFYEVVRKRLGSAAYGLFASVFAELPFCVVLNEGVIAMHGGVPEGVSNVFELRSLRKGEEDVTDPIALQVLWNDPSEDVDTFGPSPRGAGARVFGRLALESFLKGSGGKVLIRAHEPVDDGFMSMFGGSLVTVFSCKYYGIRPSIAVIERGFTPRKLLVEDL